MTRPEERAVFHQVRHAARSERGAACSDEDRVHNDVFGLVEAKPFGDDFDQCRGGYHTDFDGVREDVRKDGVKLCGQKLRCYIENTGNAGGVLGGECGNCRHGVNSVCDHGFDVCLNAGASAGITSRDC